MGTSQQLTIPRFLPFPFYILSNSLGERKGRIMGYSLGWSWKIESSTLEWHHLAHRDFDKKMRVRLLLFPFFFVFESGSPVWWCQERATSPRSLSTWFDELGMKTLAVRKGSRVLQEDRVELTPVCQSKSEDWVSESVKSPSIPSRKVRSMRSLSPSGVVWSFLGGQ